MTGALASTLLRAYTSIRWLYSHTRARSFGCGPEPDDEVALKGEGLMKPKVSQRFP